MSCPYFLPQTPVSDGSLAAPARIPLGLLYRGECHAGLPGATHAVAADDCCNFGYGHGRCGSFPRDAEADAVRFTLTASRELVWILEKDFAPLRHGGLSEAGPIVRKQAEVFLENYERYILRTPSS